MKFVELSDKIRRTCINFVERSDVVLKINREDLASLLSELLNNVNEGVDETCEIPLKYNADCTKGIPNNKRVFFTIEDYK